MSNTFSLIGNLIVERIQTLALTVSENFTDNTDSTTGTMNQTVLYGEPVIEQDSIKLISYDEE